MRFCAYCMNPISGTEQYCNAECQRQAEQAAFNRCAASACIEKKWTAPLPLTCRGVGLADAKASLAKAMSEQRAIATYNELKAIKGAARYSPEAAGTTSAH